MLFYIHRGKYRSVYLSLIEYVYRRVNGSSYMARKLKAMSLVFEGINKARELNINDQYEERLTDFVIGANAPENYDGLSYVLSQKTLTQVHVINVLTPCVKQLGEKAVLNALLQVHDGFLKASIIRALGLDAVEIAK